MFKRLITAALVFGAAATAPPVVQAQAQMLCGPRELLVQRLAEDYGEDQKGAGLRGPGALYELWISDRTGSWTFIVTRPDGVACMLADGQNWVDMPKAEEVAGDPA